MEGPQIKRATLVRRGIFVSNCDRCGKSCEHVKDIVDECDERGTGSFMAPVLCSWCPLCLEHWNMVERYNDWLERDTFRKTWFLSQKRRVPLGRLPLVLAKHIYHLYLPVRAWRYGKPNGRGAFALSMGEMAHIILGGQDILNNCK